MPECYLCGVFIPRGEGYRRQVMTTQSGRVYVGRLRGASYGQSYGLRTVCSTCAKIQDRTSQGSWIRGFFCIGGWALCIKLALELTNNQYDIQQPMLGFLILFLVVGAPVWIIDAIVGSSRRKQIIEETIKENYGFSEHQAALLHSKELAYRKGETVNEWSRRLTSYANKSGDFEVCDEADKMVADLKKMAVYSKPLSGETLAQYGQRNIKYIEDLESEDDKEVIDFNSPKLSFRQGETVDKWCKRIATYVKRINPLVNGDDLIDLIESIKESANFSQPMTGETVKQYTERNLRLIQSLKDGNQDDGFDFNNEEFAFRSGESVNEWCKRILSYTNRNIPEAFDSVQNAVEALKVAADRLPPKEGDTIATYLERNDQLLKRLDEQRKIDLDSYESAIQPDESAREWIQRVAPSFLIIEEDDDENEIMSIMANIAIRARPLKNETAKAWLKRVAPLIDEANKD